MCEANAGLRLEHQDVDKVLKIPVVKRLGIPHSGKVFEERVVCAFLPGKSEIVYVRENGSFVVVCLSAELHPN